MLQRRARYIIWQESWRLSIGGLCKQALRGHLTGIQLHGPTEELPSAGRIGRGSAHLPVYIGQLLSESPFQPLPALQLCYHAASLGPCPGSPSNYQRICGSLWSQLERLKMGSHDSVLLSWYLKLQECRHLDHCQTWQKLQSEASRHLRL